ncbi:hypothetical protein BKA70DRAFT_1301584 [Coprinopsis sp. MPI-PUGE-AT-0042]|nr:hypothetical protein BKA70DRAFT_1301584 [Coprinopsis sp. MPI-PUGE-AT-0042]
MADSPIEKIWAASRKSYAPSMSQAGGSSNRNSNASDFPYNLWPYDPVTAYDDGAAFYDRFIEDKGIIRVFFSGCVAYNRTLDAIAANQRQLRARRQESIVRASLAEWKARLLTNPVDSFGKKHWELGLNLIESFGQQIQVDVVNDTMLVPRYLGMENNDNFRVSLFNQQRPESILERLQSTVGRNRTDN